MYYVNTLGLFICEISIVQIFLSDERMRDNLSEWK